MARICIPVCANTVESLISATQAASEWADLVELRLDYLSAEGLARLPLSQLENKFDLVITLRDPNQGGQRDLTYAERESFWREQLRKSGKSLFDIELDLANHLNKEGAISDWSRVVCSHHDFGGVPADLDLVYQQIAQTRAGVIKLAVRANEVTDCLSIFQLIDRARSEGREIIAIAMGAAGIVTRILGPSRGAFLTFAASEQDRATAPGQLTQKELRQTYRINDLNRDTAIYGLVGLPAMHSVSPHMHNAAFAYLDLDGVYIPFEVGNAIEFFGRMVHPLTREINWNIRGLSITAPHKLTVMQAVDWIDSDAVEIGAVNTVVVEGDRLLGYNTDAAGFLGPLQQHLGDIRDAHVAIVGAGGAANAVTWALSKEKANVTVFARDESKAANVATRFGVSSNRLSDASFGNYDLLVNTTPLGSAGEEVLFSPVSIEQLGGVSLVYDLVYNPLETLLLKHARSAGCRTLNGLQMLVAQAALQFRLWTGSCAPVDAMQAAAATALSDNRSDYL